MKIFSSLYLNNRLFYLLGGSFVLLTLSFLWPVLLPVGQAALFVVAMLWLADIVWLFNSKIDVVVERHTPRLMSLGDPNRIRLTVKNMSPTGFDMSVIDELPYQLQKRDFLEELNLDSNRQKEISYDVKPLVRGEYNFGHTMVYIRSRMNLVSRRIKASNPEMVKVYPSIIQMKKFQLAANPRLSQFLGVKRMRRIGHSYEFEQIKNYVPGDDYRSLNWKATGRHSALMVNQFQDETSQPIYCIIDKSRQMKLPFEGLSLMDHAINTALVVSNVALQKNDRAGLITFADKIDTILKAENRTRQLRSILESLYNQKESAQEANFELLYKLMQRSVRNRSMIILFSNLESRHTLNRIKGILKRLGSFHLLLVVFFENTELADYANNAASDITDTYLLSAANHMNDEKQLLIQELNQFGVHTVLTRPEDLTINTLNKYLEFKARGLI